MSEQQPPDVTDLFAEAENHIKPLPWVNLEHPELPQYFQVRIFDEDGTVTAWRERLPKACPNLLDSILSVLNGLRADELALIMQRLLHELLEKAKTVIREQFPLGYNADHFVLVSLNLDPPSPHLIVGFIRFVEMDDVEMDDNQEQYRPEDYWTSVMKFEDGELAFATCDSNFPVEEHPRWDDIKHLYG